MVGLVFSLVAAFIVLVTPYALTPVMVDLQEAVFKVRYNGFGYNTTMICLYVGMFYLVHKVIQKKK